MSNENYDSNTPEEVIKSWRISDEKFPRGLKEQPMSNRELELSIKDIDSIKMLELADKRFKELSHYGFDWRSFKNGYVEAIALMLSISQPDKRVEEVIEMIDRLINVNQFSRDGASVERANLAADNVLELTKIRNKLTMESTDDHY